jgi:membrane peptidoglycan carboxypeptidase
MKFLDRFLSPEAKKNIGFYSLVGVIAGLSAILGVASVVFYQVYFGDTSELKKSTILARINEQTTIYADDETTQFGSFFDQSHREYVEIEKIPPHMIRAMVASEDKNFYQHIGIDPIAIADAAVEGVLAGFRFQRGGSTITQQTVKNIMGSTERTFRRKFKEMIRALQLERMYTKTQILEFYLNQFHVTANGNGIGIASRYYFNKEVQDLTLVEAAFIAGSVKAPSRYNPFIKYTQEKRDHALEEANQRKNYVLRRMYEQSWITEDEFKQAFVQDVPFKKGKFRTEEVALMSLIRGQVDRKEILEAVDLDDITELDNAGLVIYTTLNADWQKMAQLAMRRNLSRLETILGGFRVENPEKFTKLRSLEVNEYYYGKVAKIDKLANGEVQVELDFGLPKGVIPYESLMRTAKILVLPTYEDYRIALKQMTSTIKVGDVLFVEVMEYDRENHRAVLELRKDPKINGGMIAVDKGEVRAVVSGFDAKGFNRAMFSTKQPGSVFKSVVYFAALQLGWTVLDRVDNERRVFPFQGKFYYPRPDHISPYKQVSMLWAGVKSENLASIYLTSHLLDKLNFGEFKALMKELGLLPHEGESSRDYQYRVAKETGVQLDNMGIKEHLLSKALEDLRPDLVFNRQMDIYGKMSKMWWGRGYAAEIRAIYEADDAELSLEEKRTRIELAKNNYERMVSLGSHFKDDWDSLAKLVQEKGPEAAFTDPNGKTIVSYFRVISSRGGKPELAYVRTLPEEEEALRNLKMRSAHPIASLTPTVGRALNPFDVGAIWGSTLFGAEIKEGDVKLEGYMPYQFLTRIQTNLDERYNSILADQDKYYLYRYFNHHDFRIILGLKYLVALSKLMGVYSPLEPVLSFPLGTNDVSVAEVSKIYQTFTDGKIYRFYEDGPSNQLNFIKRIEDRNGSVLYEPKKKEMRIVSQCVTSQISEILRKVVTHGTGRWARGELYLSLDAENEKTPSEVDHKGGLKVRVEAFGKTGTTNDYTTSYFAGYVPYPTRHRAPLRVSDSHVLAAYVGYDRSKTMRRGGYKISGAQGALPLWSDFAKAIITGDKYTDYIDRYDLSLLSKQVWPLENAECTAPTKVDIAQGIMVRSDQSEDEVFDFTNMEEEGETYMNEFARNANIQSFVSLALSVKDGQRRPMSFFEPVKLDIADEENLEDWHDPLKDQDVAGGKTSLEPPSEAAPVYEEKVEGETPKEEKPLPEDGELGRQLIDNPPVSDVSGGGASTSSPRSVNASSASEGENSDPAVGGEKEEEDEEGFIEEDLW